jgi:hypothetical protein
MKLQSSTHDYCERPDNSGSSLAKPVHAGTPALLFVSKASRFTLLVSKSDTLGRGAEWHGRPARI